MPERSAEERFPLPFSGILFVATVPDQVAPAVLASLAYGCGLGHAHNFAVETDARQMRIHTTALGIGCIERVMSGGS